MAADSEATGKAINKANNAAAAANSAAVSAGNAAQAAANAASTAQSTANAALPKTGGAMTGEVDMGNNNIRNVKDPEDDTDAANKKYVTDYVATYVAAKIPDLNDITQSVIDNLSHWEGGSY